MKIIHFILLFIFHQFCLSYDWRLLNPTTTTDAFTISSYGGGTIAAFTRYELFVKTKESSTFQQVSNIFNQSDSVEWLDTCYFSNASLFMLLGQYVSTAGQNTLVVMRSMNAFNWSVSNLYTIQGVNPSIACGKNEIYMSTGVSVVSSINGSVWETHTPLGTFYNIYYIEEFNYYVAWSETVPIVYTSRTDKGVWDLHAGPPKVSYSAIVYGRGTYVIAGSDVVYWSNNLAGWSVSQLGTTAGFEGLTFSESLNKFLITYTNDTGLFIYSSVDGNVWSLSTSLTANRCNINSILSVNNSDFIGVYAFGAVGSILSSNDTIKWDLVSGAFWDDLHQIEWEGSINKEWVASGRAQIDGSNFLYFSKDGVTWVKNSNATDSWTQFKGKFKFLSSANVYLSYTNDQVFSSIDLQKWQIVFDLKYYNLISITSLYITPSGNNTVLTCKGSRLDEIWISNNAIDWARVLTKNAPTSLGAVFPLSDSKFLVINDTWVTQSDDMGVTWKNISARIKDTRFVAWVSNKDYILNIGNSNFTVAAKNSLDQWTTQRRTLGTNKPYIVFQNSFFGFATKSGRKKNKMEYSKDGKTWIQQNLTHDIMVVNSFGVSQNNVLGVGNLGVSLMLSQS